MYVLFNLTISVVLGFVGTLLLQFNFLLAIYSLAVLVPSLAVSARRLHDTGRSGFLLFLLLIPIIGGIILIVFCVQDSQEGDNKYGSNPKAQTV